VRSQAVFQGRAKQPDVLTGAFLEHHRPSGVELAHDGGLELDGHALTDEIVDEPSGSAVDESEAALDES
jgi:hypothetical protein